MKILNNYETLRDYALWYYFRYFPSTEKLSRKLLEKSDKNKQLSQDVLKSMKNLINDKEVIITKINNYLYRNKNLNYIKNKLREKLFDKILVNEILEEYYLEDDKSLLRESHITKKINEYKLKWKSRKYIYQTLVERKEDQEIVSLLLDKNYLPKEELENILIHIQKLKNKSDDKKIIEKLLRKGFDYVNIKEVMKSVI